MSTIIRIGQIPYLNCEPFFHGLDLEGIELKPMPPSSMGPLARSGDLDAGPFSLVQSFDLRDTHEILGNMGIGVKGPVLSILLYSRVPMSELSGNFIGVTQESATASQLLRVLLENYYNVKPRAYVDLSASQQQAFLLIGDQALAADEQLDGFPYRYDLSDVWLQCNGLPFVFAVWMIRRDLPSDYKIMLANRIKDNLLKNMEHNLDIIADKRSDVGIRSDQIIAYLKAFRYVLSTEEWQGAEEFERTWRSLQ